MTDGLCVSLPPCSVCGYNGPGYYQPSQHPCVDIVTDGLRLGPLPPGRIELLPKETMPRLLPIDCLNDAPDLRNLRAWLELQSVSTINEVVETAIEELRQRRGGG